MVVMKHKITLSLGLLAALFLFSAPARADIDLEVSGLIGTGVDTGDAPNNPYSLQLGALGELIIDDFVIGMRGTRSMGNDDDCEQNCPNVKDLRTLGGDLGFEWDLVFLHIGPRVGFGYIKERNGDRRTGYIEPGAVAEVQLAMFAVGAELRYRVAVKESDLNAFLAYARIGLRF